MLELLNIQIVKQKAKLPWRVRVRFAGSYVEQRFEDRHIAWEFVQSWLPEEDEPGVS